MRAVYAPYFFGYEVLIAQRKELLGGHHTFLEEVFRHPVDTAFSVEEVGEFAVHEDVNEERAVGQQPAIDVLEQLMPVAHVFEHFDGDDAVKLSVGLEGVHVGGDDGEVGHILCVDVGFLGGGVGDGGDGGVGIGACHPEGEGAPAAAEFENLLAVGKLRALAGDFEHFLFGFFEGRVGLLPEATAVF